VYHFVNFADNYTVDFDKSQAHIIAVQNQIDSLKEIELEKRKPKIYPFNPNYITDYKGGKLGMSIEEIDKLLAYRKKGKFVNSAKEFQKITHVSDSLLSKISPYFKFPDWVNKRNKKKTKQSKRVFNNAVKKSTVEISTSDINLATQNDFLAIEGVDEKLSDRIIKYRTKLKGFSITAQVFEVWGLEKETGDQIIKTFKIRTPPSIEKFNVNTATFKEVLSIPYINYELCVKIFNYRDEVAELQSISELKNIEDFPIDKYERIVLYLQAK
jgi:DNA uptake protein ComE-like DNA-binding protein